MLNIGYFEHYYSSTCYGTMGRVGLQCTKMQPAQLPKQKQTEITTHRGNMMSSSVQVAIVICLYMQVVFCCYIDVQNIQFVTFKSSYNEKNWRKKGYLV